MDRQSEATQRVHGWVNKDRRCWCVRVPVFLQIPVRRLQLLRASTTPIFFFNQLGLMVLGRVADEAIEVCGWERNPMSAVLYCTRNKPDTYKLLGAGEHSLCKFRFDLMEISRGALLDVEMGVVVRVLCARKEVVLGGLALEPPLLTPATEPRYRRPQYPKR